MPTANEDWRDALLRRQIGLLRLSQGTRREVVDILNDTEASLSREIERRLRAISSPDGVNLTRPAVVERLLNLQRRIQTIRAAAFSESLTLWDRTLRDLISQEVGFLSMSLQTVLPVVYTAIEPDLRRLRGLVGSDPFRGPGEQMLRLRQWVNTIATDDVERIMGTIRAGLVEGAPSREIARRVVGTARLRGTDGVTQITRNAAQTLTRTSINHFANQAKRAWYMENADVISDEVYTATLDGRTTAICRSLDGRRFEVGKGPYPPLHPNCRSLRIALIDGQVLGQRPMKPVTERMLLREYADANGLRRVARRADLPRGTKVAFDRFARVRTRELIGRVPARTTYQEWLRNQSREFQDDVLGVTKARLFRRGNLTLDRFVDERGREYNLRELALRDREAFRAAGLDPTDFTGRQAA